DLPPAGTGQRSQEGGGALGSGASGARPRLPGDRREGKGAGSERPGVRRQGSQGLRFPLGVLLGLALLAGPARAEDTAAPRVIKIVAKKFDFTPSEIHIKKGEHVVLELTSSDRKHGFKVPELGIRVDVQPGTTTRVDVTP